MILETQLERMREMLHKIGEEELEGGFLLEWAYDDSVESPRTWRSPLGHFYCWGNRFNSPDECRFDEPEEFIAFELQKRFTLEELEKAVDDGMFDSLRFVEDPDGGEKLLEGYMANMLTGAEGWSEVEEFNEWRDLEEIAKAISYCAEAPKLLSQKGVLMTVYRFEHSDVAYSTKPFNDRWDSGAVGFIWVSDAELAEQEMADIPKEDIRKILDAEVEEYSAWANGDTHTVMLSKDDVVVDCIGGYYGDEQLEEGKAEMRRVAAETLKDACAKVEVLIPEAVALPSSHEIDTMRELGSALKRLTDVQFDLNRIFGDEAYPGSYSLYEARCAVTSKLAELLDELAVRELRGCGDAESIEKLWCENPTEIDQSEVEERLRRYGID